MNRRVAMRAIGAGFGALLVPHHVSSQEKLPVLGLPLIAAGPDDPVVIDLRKGLADFGYADERNIRILYRSSGGRVERLPFILRELAQLKVDIIVAGAAPIVAAAREATSTIPIVMVGWGYDPVAAGFVDTLGRPGGNLTGVYLSTEETIGKRLELLIELLPRGSSVAVLYDGIGKLRYPNIEAAAIAAKLRVQPVEVAGSSDFPAGIKRAKAKRAAAGLVLFSPDFYVHRKAIAEAARAQRFPTVFEISSMVEAGGLISYGPDESYGWRRAGYFVSRILAGIPPSELPIEQPREYRLVVNARTAKAVGITVPESILLRADEVIRW